MRPYAERNQSEAFLYVKNEIKGCTEYTKTSGSVSGSVPQVFRIFCAAYEILHKVLTMSSA